MLNITHVYPDTLRTPDPESFTYNQSVYVAIFVFMFAQENFLRIFDAALSMIPNMSASTSVVFAVAPFISEPIVPVVTRASAYDFVVKSVVAVGTPSHRIPATTVPALFFHLWV